MSFALLIETLSKEWNLMTNQISLSSSRSKNFKEFLLSVLTQCSVSRSEPTFRISIGSPYWVLQKNLFLHHLSMIIFSLILLKKRRVPFAIKEQVRQVVEKLRTLGVLASYANADVDWVSPHIIS